MNGKWTSAGGVVLDSIDPPHRVFVCKPSNNYGPWCFPKGRVDDGDSLETTALREVSEEAGVPATMLPNGSLGTAEGSYSITHYFMMVRSGEVGPHDYEMEEVRLVTLDEAEALFAGAGNRRDVGVLTKARAYIDKNLGSAMTESKIIPSVISELRTNLLGKIFFATMGAWLVGKAVNTAIRGSQMQVEVVTNAALATKKLHEELRRDAVTVNEIMQLLEIKHSTAREFEREFGIPWPL